MNAFIPCEDGPGPGGSSSSGFNLGFTWAQCTAPSTDVDSDGVDDNCEVSLAAAFAPGLRESVGECNWDAGLNRLGGEYYYKVRRPIGATDRIRIAYMPAYYRDCGTAPHNGDTEFIGVDVKYESNSVGGNTWKFAGAFLSAHCGSPLPYLNIGSADPNCRYWGRDKWDASGAYVDGRAGGAPIVWVSKEKHANYYSLSHCNNSWSGLVNLDVCHASFEVRRFPIQHRWQNTDFPEATSWTCVPPRWGSTIPASTALESLYGSGQCNFGSSLFYGWTNPTPTSIATGGSASYRSHLVQWLVMETPIGGDPALPPCTFDPVRAFYFPGCTGN
ncbi:MAG: hypothetical protein ABI120_13410 [Gemmatimonadaceae bacterium]